MNQIIIKNIYSIYLLSIDKNIIFFEKKKDCEKYLEEIISYENQNISLISLIRDLWISNIKKEEVIEFYFPGIYSRILGSSTRKDRDKIVIEQIRIVLSYLINSNCQTKNEFNLEIFCKELKDLYNHMSTYEEFIPLQQMIDFMEKLNLYYDLHPLISKLNIRKNWLFIKDYFLKNYISESFRNIAAPEKIYKINRETCVLDFKFR